ncbi:quinone oxidoreductase family protein [Zavarzinia aquatilis]|uniref:Alcohol dehydrogenase n=1 Tax=Zavarzinia aquatilis TaxID=2211142 RepID=A0A317DZD1_9PROT|nr:quinone oxidoreductase [Zavarzinia aquatilis]PWR18413.1 alcohol dehydrogenase [Zavarzinia aquatilis]
MSLSVALAAHGGADVLQLREADVPPPGPGEVRVRQGAVGVNFVDIYHRQGLYPVPGLPAVPGVEGAGAIEALGPGVEGLHVGQRVAYAGLPIGGYAEVRNMPAGRLIPLPATVGTATAAAAMLRGITVHMLLHRVFPVGPGITVLVQAAAGGVGLVLTQWAKSLGALVIGTVGSEDKAEIALEHGLDHAILYRRQDFVAEARRLTGGKGVDVAYDGIGGETLLRTLDAVAPFGTIASIGQASGSLPAIDVADLGPRRSLALARPSVFAYAADPASYREAASDLFDMIEDGLRITVGAEFPLAEAAAAHRALEAGQTTGSILLRP